MTDNSLFQKRVEESTTYQVHIVRPQFMNSYGRLFGGALMQWIDELAGVVSRRHSGSSVTTVAVDSMVFKEPAFENDMIFLKGWVTYVGTTSMEVCVESHKETEGSERVLINRAYLVMVAVDENGKAQKSPGLILETEKQKADWEAGRRRYQYRKDHKETV